MSKFTTRVELHNAAEEDYEVLHEAMQDEGFSRTISNGDGTRYHFPTAEYNFSGNKSIDEIMESAKAAAKTTGCGFEVLVTESIRRKWYGLEKVENN